MSQFVIETRHLPNLTEHKVTRQQVETALVPLGLTDMAIWDNYFWIIGPEDWVKVFKDVLFKMPKYVSEKFNCENMAIQVMARVNYRHHLNSCGIAIGNSPLGYHGWNLFLAWIDEIVTPMYLEPQNGMIYEIDNTEGYRAKDLIIG